MESIGLDYPRVPQGGPRSQHLAAVYRECPRDRHRRVRLGRFCLHGHKRLHAGHTGGQLGPLHELHPANLPARQHAHSLRCRYREQSLLGQQNDTLLAAGEAVTPKVTRWEIGNEPENNVGTLYYYQSPTDYLSRYKTISAAMLAQDSTIKVGACSSGSTSQLAAVLADHTAQVDFVSYHPYNSGQLVNDSGLRGIKALQTSLYQNEVTALTTAGRPSTTPLIASEWNPCGGGEADEPPFNSMAQALGVAETVFTYAQLGLTGANYWVSAGVR